MRMEHWWFKAPLRLKSIFRRPRAESELDEELQFHLEHKIEEGIAEGLSPEEARYRALRAMGGLDQKKEEARDAWRIHWLTDFIDDVRYAIRSLSRTPGVAAFVVITIALGIGMTATPFSMLDALIFRPYPVPHPGNVVTLVSTSRDNAFDQFSYREYQDIRDHTKSYDGVIANADLQTVGFSAQPGVTPVVRGGMLVSGNIFRVLGVEPTLGRGFREDEDVAPGRDAVVVLSAAFWKREFAGDPSVIGRTIRLNGKDFTVIGVAPEGFTGLYIFDRPDLYMPLAMAPAFSTDPQKNFFVDRDDRELTVRARLKPGTTLHQAGNELAMLAKDFAREYPGVNRDRGAAVRTMFAMRTQESDANWKFGVIFTVLAVVVLLVACTNAAGILLSRARTRTREIAVRLAIGAGRFRLIRLLLTGSRPPGRVGRDRRRLRRHRGPPHFQHSGGAAREDPVPDGHARAPGQPRIVHAERSRLRPRAGAPEHAHGPGPRAEVRRRRRVRERAQAPVGSECAGGGADRDVADAARGSVPDVPGLPEEPGGGTRIREGSPADGEVRSPSRAV